VKARNMGSDGGKRYMPIFYCYHVNGTGHLVRGTLAVLHNIITCLALIWHGSGKYLIGTTTMASLLYLVSKGAPPLLYYMKWVMRKATEPDCPNQGLTTLAI